MIEMNSEATCEGEADPVTRALASSIVPGLTGLVVQALMREGGRPAMLAALTGIQSGALRVRWVVEMEGSELALSVVLVEGEAVRPLSLTLLRFADGIPTPTDGAVH